MKAHRLWPGLLAGLWLAGVPALHADAQQQAPGPAATQSPVAPLIACRVEPVPMSTMRTTTATDEGDVRDDYNMLVLETEPGGEYRSDAETGEERFTLFRFRYRDRELRADEGLINRDQRLMQLIGQVLYADSDFTVYGENARGDEQAGVVSFESAGFNIPERPARGEATQITLRGDRTMSLASVFFTTCPEDRTDWRLRAEHIEIDADQGIGRARRVRLDFFGVPILYAPRMTFPLDDRRKSGFLTPSFAERDRTGRDITVPYYLNIAPNYDMTISPRYLSRRGARLDTEFRYLTPRSSGQLDIEYLPDDREFDRDRSYFGLQHQTLLGRRWQVLAGLERVSDDVYFADLGTSLAISSQTHLNRFIDFGFFTPYWSLLTRVQNYQTIDSLIEDESLPYERVPQVLFEGTWYHGLMTFDSTAELVNFDRDTGDTGWRFHTNQELAFRFARPGMFLTPALSLRQTNYWLDDHEPETPDSMSRTVPIGSVDMGLRFERLTGESDRWLHTLEPRMLYLRAPYRDQSQFPVFDTIEPDFNLVQLFRKSRFIGPDRIGDANQVSIGLTTRLIDARSGRERLTATIGQTRYLRTQSVTLPGRAPNDANASDYVAELGVALNPVWNMNVGYQWNTVTESTARAETRFEYRPQDDRLFGIGYRHRSGFLEQGDISLVWPVAERWRAIARYSYSVLDRAPLEQFLGWEFESCCWRVRMVGRRYVSRRTGQFDSGISIQLELRGLSQRVTAPEDLLDRGILGYRSIAGRNL